jgi:hypothetical protein
MSASGFGGFFLCLNQDLQNCFFLSKSRLTVLKDEQDRSFLIESGLTRAKDQQDFFYSHLVKFKIVKIFKYHKS